MEILIAMYDCHTKHGSHNKIQFTWDEIIAAGLKWDYMYSDVRNLLI